MFRYHHHTTVLSLIQSISQFRERFPDSVTLLLCCVVYVFIKTVVSLKEVSKTDIFFIIVIIFISINN